MNSSAASIAELIARIRQGDDEAAAILVREYEAEVRTEVRFRLRDSQLRQVLESMDICQSILASFFVRVSLGQYDLDSPEAVIKLLVRMARNKVVDRVRQHRAARRDQRRTRPLDAGMAENFLPDPRLPPAEQAALNELYEQCRSRMTPLENEISELRGAGHSWAEIGSRLGYSSEAVRKTLQRGFARIKQELSLTQI